VWSFVVFQVPKNLAPICDQLLELIPPVQLIGGKAEPWTIEVQIPAALRSRKRAANERQYGLCRMTLPGLSIPVALDQRRKIMRNLLIPVLGLALGCVVLGPASSIANAAAYGGSATQAATHAMKPKNVAYTTHGKACHATKSHSCKPARKAAHKHTT
jgi:hypothetical protein